MQPSRELADLLTLMARLRSDCPWDAKQTNQSLIPYIIEESYELAEAVRGGDVQAAKDELGDVLLQVVFQAQLYREVGAFDFYDVIENLMTKLIRRHPHVFDKENLRTDEDVKRRWQEIKAIENAGKPRRTLDAVKAGSALMQATDIQKTAAKVGFDWQDYTGAFAKLHEEIGELETLLNEPNADAERLFDELGDCLFSMVNVARKLDIDSESALLGTIGKFKRRFAYIEDALANRGKTPDDATLDEMDALWEQAKNA